ncbi:carbohydrate kinase [Prochlorococcus sp. MIT 1307]|uniref:carbohydrate kinase family protein n=1 Tax=Prochlorococcus sp. MIT 1307 TaxID=3096219 RepID=UPI002A75DF2C|nr:carbohydrate kinase [Prochlorococcus sp. MIT 1307]
MTVDLDSLNAPQVICIGEALLDRLGPLGGDPYADKPVEDCLGGAPANVACGLAKLGINTAFAGRLGDDFIGKQFHKLFKTCGVNVQALQVDPVRPSRIVLVRRDLKGDRSFEGFQGGEEHGFADQALEVKALKETWPGLLSNAGWLLAGTIPLATTTSAETLLWGVEQAIKKEVKFALDINWRPTFWSQNLSSNCGPNDAALKKIAILLENASLLKLANEEARWFFNTSDPVKISRSLPNRPDVVVTNGARPLHWVIGGFAGEMKVFSPQTVVDTTGAGDAFTAGLLQQYLTSSFNKLNQEVVEEAVRFAAACGALVCGGPGGIDPQPTYEEIKNFLQDL